MADISKFMSKDIGDLDKSHRVDKSNLSKILGLNIPGGSCPASANAGTSSIYGPISNLCNVVDGFGTNPTDYYRIVIPASENLYSGIQEYGHDFTMTIKSLPYDYTIYMDWYMSAMGPNGWEVDGATYVNPGYVALTANVDEVVGPIEFLMAPATDIIIEVVLQTTTELPMSSDIVAGHAVWHGTTPGPVWSEKIADTGKRALILNMTEV